MFDDILDKPKPKNIGVVPVSWGHVCPAHGDVGSGTIVSTIVGHEGTWCLLCVIEGLEKLGLQKL